METLNKIRLNNQEEYDKLHKEELIGGFCCWGFHDKPTHYPCILGQNECIADFAKYGCSEYKSKVTC